MLVISDTTPLRYLAVIGHPELLATIFGDVWVPGAVLDELRASSTPDVVRALIESWPPWLHAQDPAPGPLSNINLDLDPGERAALALALELNADLLLIDDAAGRREAATLGIRITGTMGILRLAAERNLIDIPASLAALRSAGFYIHDAVIRSAFSQWLPK